MDYIMNAGEMDVTCLTPGCENEGITLSIPVDLDAPAVVCGPCGEWIIAPPEDPAPE